MQYDCSSNCKWLINAHHQQLTMELLEVAWSVVIEWWLLLFQSKFGISPPHLVVFDSCNSCASQGISSHCCLHFLLLTLWVLRFTFFGDFWILLYLCWLKFHSFPWGSISSNPFITYRVQGRNYILWVPWMLTSCSHFHPTISFFHCFECYENILLSVSWVAISVLPIPSFEFFECCIVQCFEAMNILLLGRD